MSFLTNAWYVAAWSNEVEDTPLARTLLNKPIVLFRSGREVVAMLDRCPHRFAPLSLGKVQDGAIQCGYHGLSFDKTGRCVGNPLGSVTPSAARVPTFEVCEQDRAIWIWLGDPASIGETRPPSIAHHVDPTLQCVFGYTLAKANYRLLSDNLMDLSHSAFLHPAFGGLAYVPKVKSWENPDGSITSDHLIASMPNFVGLDAIPHDHVRNQDTIHWHAPSTHILDSRMGPVDADPTLLVPSAHILTPETRTTSHYFWSSASPPGAMSDEEMVEFLRGVFDGEDKPMVEAVQRRMGEAEFWDLHPVLLHNDAGAVRVRRKLAELIKAEESVPTSSSAARVPA